MKEKFENIFVDCTSDGIKIPKECYLKTGNNIIVDQGQNEIAGWTNEEKGLYKDVPAIIFGDHTRAIKYIDRPFFLGADGVKLLKAKNKNDNYKYLYYALKNAKILDLGYNRHFKLLKEIKIEYPNINIQNNIVEKLDKISSIIHKHKQVINLFDMLIKSQFVEMFGDPTTNLKNIKTYSMPEVCKIIDGDRGKNYPVASEFFDKEYCLFLNAKNVTQNGFVFNDCMFITKEKDEILRNGKLELGDVVLTTRGTIGNLAFYNDKVPFKNIRINSGMVILRMDKKLINEVYFIEQFKMQLDNIKRKIVSGTAQPQLPISTMNKINILVADINKQEEFADFVKKCDKLEFIAQKSLNKTQMLFDSLMQKYFG